MSDDDRGVDPDTIMLDALPVRDVMGIAQNPGVYEVGDLLVAYLSLAQWGNFPYLKAEVAFEINTREGLV